MTFKRCVDDEAASKPYDFLWFPVATPITGENHWRGDKLLLRLGKWKEKWDKGILAICVFPCMI